MAAQQALWLPGIGKDLIVGPRDERAPGPGELLVKIISTALEWMQQEKVFFESVLSFPAVIGEDGAGTVEAVGEGVADFGNEDRV
jgi:NADPH:quinone reductase-like Zn-dependent oxidoreductase